MIAVKNISDKKIEIPFEGYTYKFKEGSTLLITEDLYNHIRSIWEKGVFKEIKKSQKQMLRAPKVKTPAVIKQEPIDTFKSNDMKITKGGTQSPTLSNPDATPASGTIDGDGVEWYGEGAVIEGNREAFK